MNTQSIQSLGVDTDRSFGGQEGSQTGKLTAESEAEDDLSFSKDENDFSYVGTCVFENSDPDDVTNDSGQRNDWESLLPTVVGRYRILAPIGEGGMGVVFKGVDEELGRMVAIKTLKDTGYNKSFYDLFLAEARQLARLNHPSVVAIYDAGRIGRRPFFVMEWLNGVTLAERMSKAPIKADSARDLFLQLLDALDAVHKMGIVHRDVKPANVMLSAAAKFCCLLDFGLASTDGQRETTGVSGTPGYFAPEVLKGFPGDF
ncbi:MAG: serine/threonine-protein kinase [Planctomycetota bacterium]|nr:serine/threonine-protein kinase [Planctomycetota bacterium]